MKPGAFQPQMWFHVPAPVNCWRDNHALQTTIKQKLPADEIYFVNKAQVHRADVQHVVENR